LGCTAPDIRKWIMKREMGTLSHARDTKEFLLIHAAENTGKELETLRFQLKSELYEIEKRIPASRTRITRIREPDMHLMSISRNSDM
jgi:hypothetical protein